MLDEVIGVLADIGGGIAGRVEQAADGVVDRVVTSPCDLASVMMPGLDGDATTAAIRQLTCMERTLGLDANDDA